MESLLGQLKETLPCRSNQIQELYNHFIYKDEPFIDNIFIYGGPSVGKSLVVTTILQKLNIKHVIINLIECYSTKILFETILNKLFKVTAKCENILDFVNYLQMNTNQIEEESREPVVIVIDKTEKLKSMDSNLFSSLLRLRELSNTNFITIIYLSEIIFEKFYFTTINIIEPIKIYFPQYTKDELLEILLLDFEEFSLSVINNCIEMFEFDLDFYRNYLNILLSVFYRACRDLSELRHISSSNFIKYCEPIINKECGAKDSMVLWKKISPILKKSLEVLYLRISPEEQKLFTLSQAQCIELPFYAKYLLIAAYLASYNSSKDDKRLFMKYHGKKRKTQKDITRKNKISEQLNTQLGPKPFDFDRLLAIFYSILDERIGFNNNLLVQISSLVELQLLTALNDNCSLDGQKYKCNVNFEFIQTISKMVGFRIQKYLSDFSHI